MKALNSSNIEEFYKNFDNIDVDKFIKDCFFENKKEVLLRNKKYVKILLLYLNRYSLLKKLTKKKIMLNYSLYDYAKDIFNNKNEYIKLYNLLGDSLSKETLLDILKYKVTFDRTYLNNNIRPTQDQYLDSRIMNFTDEEVVVDCGAYIGDSILTYYKYVKSVAKYYALEPDLQNFNNAKRILSYEDFKNIEFCRVATGNENKTLKFTSSEAAGFVSDEGNNEVQIVKLDDFIKEPITFIKMDIEGSELSTLQGAANQIKNNKPKLAICAYHKPDDLWNLTNEILSMRSDYKVYLRLYLSTFCEAVLYFV